MMTHSILHMLALLVRAALLRDLSCSVVLGGAHWHGRPQPSDWNQRPL